MHKPRRRRIASREPAQKLRDPDLLLAGGGTGVVLVAPDPVPDTGNQAGSDEDDGGVVDRLGGDGNGTGHTKERHGEGRPGF